MGRHSARMRRIEHAIQPEHEFSGVGYRLFWQTADGWTEGEGLFSDDDLEELRLAGQLLLQFVPIGRDGCDARGVPSVAVPS